MSGYAAYGGPNYASQDPRWGSGPQTPPNWAPPNGGSPNWAPPGWHYRGPGRFLGIALTILGFMIWWPVGLVVLGFTLGRKRMDCSSMFSEARQEWREQRRAWKRGWRFGGDAAPRQAESSGNRAFDDYRTETLRRLEEEQQEFSSFLDRLRFAKDKAEFDAFMAERRRGAEPPPDAHPA
jgi:hypothetical protein